MGLLIGVVVLLVVVMIILAKSICIVPQSQVYIIERLGQFAGELHSGMHFLVPFLNRIRSKMSLAELAYDVPPMDVITKDTVSIRADSFVFYTIFDAKLATYGCRNLREGLSTLAISTLRSVIGKLDLEQCLQSRAEISTQMTRELDEATDKWGIKVTRVEIKTFQPPRNIQDAMERQMKAERERREQLTMAQAAKEAAILDAQKNKEVQILNAEAARSAAELNAEANRIAIVQKAEAEKEAMLLRAEAEKQVALRKAEAQAEAIRLTEIAKAEGIKAINAATPTDATLRVKAYDAFRDASHGEATKIIIPSDLQGIVGMASAVKSVLK